jgi:hypothetical protein
VIGDDDDVFIVHFVEFVVQEELEIGVVLVLLS